MSESSSPYKGLLYGGLASCFAETLTMPIDVVKTRLQMDGAASVKRFAGARDCASRLLRDEGPAALFKGLTPALLRQSVYGSLRYGLYAPIRNALGATEEAPPPAQIPAWKKVCAGASAGALASGIANPTDLVKVRMQTDGMSAATGSSALAGGEAPRRYRGVLHCLATTLREEGLLGLWTGLGPTMGRATALAAAELSAYDEVKSRLLRSGFVTGDGLALHIACAFVSGYAATVVSSPFDVVKSRIMGQPTDVVGRGTLYSGTMDCLFQIVRDEGVMSLYKGFWPNLARIVPRVTIIFVVMEQLKARFG